MKRIGLISILIGLGVIYAFPQNFYLDENGVTVKCDNCQPGDTGTVNGILFEAVDRELLDQRVKDTADLTVLCTSLVTEMNSLFYETSGFNPDIGSWDVSNVTDMGSMFSRVTAFNQDIGSWDVSNVTNMSWMFKGFWGHHKFNQDIGSWDVSNVTDMKGMFHASESFNQDLSGWCVENINSQPESFATGCPLQPDFYPIWGTCPYVVKVNDIDNIGLVNIHPNPTNKLLTIESVHPKHYSINITSLNGQLIHSEEMEGTTHQLNLSTFQKGIYFITIRSNDFVTTKKIIKL